MQAVCFVMGWVFASGIGSLRCVLFCRRVGFPQGQLYAVVFLVRGVLRKRKPWSFLRGGFLSAVFVHGVYTAVFLVRGGFRKCKPFVLSWGGFLQAVLVPCGAVCFVMGCVFPRGSCTQLCLLCWAVCVSASRLFCRGVFFCKKYYVLFFGKKKLLCALHGFFLRKLVGLGCCLLSIFIFKTQSVASNARIACKTIKSTHSHGI